MTALLTFIFGMAVLLLIAGAAIWAGVVNHIERKQKHELARAKQRMAQQKLDHQQWLDMQGITTSHVASEPTPIEMENQ